MAKASARSWREEAAFALPAAPLMALTLPPIIYLPPYYHEHLGLDLAAVGSAFFAARMLDVFIDPAIGAWQDATRTRLGRRRAWMLGMTPLLMLAIWAAFLGLSPNASFAALIAAVFALYLLMSSMLIAHLGWAAELRPDYHGRTRLLGAVQIASAIGEVLILALPVVIQLSGMGGFADGVRAMGWALIVFAPVSVAVCALSVREPLRPRQPPMPLKAAIGALADNRDFARLLASDFMIALVQGMTGGLFVFVFRYALGLGDFSEALLLIYFVASLLGVPLWVRLARRLGKRETLQIGLIAGAAVFLLMPVVPPGAHAMALLAMVLAGLCAGPTILIVRSMLADVIDEDHLATGAQRAGLFFGVHSTTHKIGLAAGPLSYVVLERYGFDAQLGADNPPEAILALQAMFALGPLLLLAAAALLLRRYSITEARQRDLRAALQARGLTGEGEAPPPDEVEAARA